MNIRINDIECRNNPNWKEDNYEILKWYKNDYYGKEAAFIREGYEKVEYPSGSWGLKKGNGTINESCFKNPESCYVIAYLKPNRNSLDVDMETVGSRILALNPEELKLFMKVYRIANDMIEDSLNEEE